MPNQAIYQEYVNETLVPYCYVLTFETGEINWEKTVFYFEVIEPTVYYEREFYDESIISTSIFLSDLIVSDAHPDKLGLYLPNIKKRINDFGVDPYLVTQFVIPTQDISEVFQLLPNSRNFFKGGSLIDQG
ncbi:hypothetical protein GCM10008967_00030 [Bacillus carboniphilus]|uniref:Uncharacterized protein n=1 Tax=Bacillus carboniphilus TaxID=86663 RepID=A0ABN0VNV5_9BACI